MEGAPNMRTSILRAIASATAVLAVILLGTTAEAQNLAQPGPAFHVELVPRLGGVPAVEGFVYNEGLRWLSDIRLRVEVLDADGSAVEEASGWVGGDLAPRGRGYFVVAVKRGGAAYRVSVLSFDVVSEGGA
jgi:hypothetical protein